MRITRNILIAFVLNLSFAIFECIGGVFTGSVAIVSDAIHDMGDAASIGLSYFLERKSKKQPDNLYTYGYGGFSVLGGLISGLVLILGSVVVVYNAICKIINPVVIHYDGMILFSVVGMTVNFVAAVVTREGGSLNQKAVNLHMLEDVLGWVVVFVGAIIMRFTDIAIIDPIMSIGVAVFIFINALSNLKEGMSLLLGKIPDGISVAELKNHLLEMEGVEGVHHVHLWSNDGQNKYATMHIVSDGDVRHLKEMIREELKEYGIYHVTLEFEKTDEECREMTCCVLADTHLHHHHHHHHTCHHHHH